ncbi:unnamed protein product [Peronospora farinosa]|uniref:Alcohol dehydrogenase-like N-terminal domain-containing protein n=1 Tax=Peronospora farinosa TaxID=134698 RepID=A0AAV0UT43_9STRA|nr:unnamed protein product [Peronospora farinosa]CAI5738820.1 unnamed protein product [Peronospora farinosa]
MSAADGTSNIKNKNSHCGTCGSDLHTIESVGDLLTCPCVVGHKIVGEVTLAGPDVKVGDRVGVGVGVGDLACSCLKKDPSVPCNECLSDDHAYCTHRVLTYNDKYKKNGETSHGGHPDYVRVAHKDAFKILDNIPSDGAAPLLCADTTVLISLKEDRVKPDKRVGVEDIGDLGHKFAHAIGDDAVMAFSNMTKKEEKMADLGATEFVIDKNKKQAATVIGLTDVLRSSYAKVLTAIALLACVAARVATSAWMPQDVMRSSRALKAAHTPFQAKRNLRINAAKSDHTYNFGERGVSPVVVGQRMAMELSPVEAAALEKLSQMHAGNVHEAAGNIILGKFSQRVEGFTHSDSKRDIYDRLLKLFLEKVDEDYTLAILLSAEAKIEETKSFAEHLQAAQIRYWHQKKKSAADVFDLLRLGTSNENLFENPLLGRLVDYIKSKTPNKTISSVYPTLYSILSSKFNDEDLVKTLVEGAKAAGEDSFAPKLLLMRLLKGQFAGESDETVINFLGSNNQRLFTIYHKFLFFFDNDSPEASLIKLKEMFGESKTVEMLYTTNEASDVATPAKDMLQVQFAEWQKDIVDDQMAEELLEDVPKTVAKEIVDMYVNHVNSFAGYPQ